MRNRDRVASGFTLLEVLVALTVLAVGAAVAISLLTGSSNNIRKAQQRSKIMEYAESVMEEALLDDTILTPTSSNGNFADGTNWTLNVEQYVPELPTELQNVNQQNLQYQLLQYTLDMFSPGSNVAIYRLQTLKMTKVSTSK
jgi:type II secretion system protein I